MRSVALVAGIGVCLLTGCSHVHSFHQEPMDLRLSGHSVETTLEKNVIMRFNTDTSWIEAARGQLLAKCPSGKITGVSSRLSTKNSFLNWDYHFHVKGICLD